MAKGRAVPIVLEAPEKSELTALTRKHGAPQVLAGRARIVLAAAPLVGGERCIERLPCVGKALDLGRSLSQGIGTSTQEVDRITIKQDFEGISLAQFTSPGFTFGEPRLPPRRPKANSLFYWGHSFSCSGVICNADLTIEIRASVKVSSSVALNCSRAAPAVATWA